MLAERGKLIVRLRKTKPALIQVQVNGKQPLNVAACEVSQSVLDRLDELNSKDVEFDLVGGQPKKIREADGSFIPPVKGDGAAAQRAQKRGPGRSNNTARPDKKQDQSGGEAMQRPDYHNPYNFVPAPPRNIEDPELGDHRSIGQDTFETERYTGRICVRMITETPLLVPDTEGVRESRDGHKSYPLRVSANRKPLIPASSIRGMLRSAYEAVTNSRFGCFSYKQHSERLAYRMGAQKKLYPVSPWDLLPKSLRPAATIDELSPADRVFGWVKGDAPDSQSQNAGEDNAVAVRGLLRVGPVICESSVEEAVESFDPGVPLAILSAPKPQQGRFYVAESQAGEAQRNGLSKGQAGYSPGKWLRGRKFYPHQASLPDKHWENPTQDITQEGRGNPAHYQEYRRPKKDGKEQRDDQNRSILGWIKPGAQFTFELHVHNLSAVELGALLWLLKLPKDHFFRLGSGKPLGFGSVQLTIEKCDVHRGNELRRRYEAWHTETSPNDPSDVAVQAFMNTMVKAYPSSSPDGFKSIPFIQAFLSACRGHADNLPIHYPRATTNGQPGPPSPDGESFKWFVANEENSAHYALPDLANDPGLPTLKKPLQRGVKA